MEHCFIKQSNMDQILDVIKHIYKKSKKASQLTKTNGNTPLHIAANSDNQDVVTFLIKEFPKQQVFLIKKDKFL